MSHEEVNTSWDFREKSFLSLPTNCWGGFRLICPSGSSVWSPYVWVRHAEHTKHQARSLLLSEGSWVSQLYLRSTSCFINCSQKRKSSEKNKFTLWLSELWEVNLQFHNPQVTPNQSPWRFTCSNLIIYVVRPMAYKRKVLGQILSALFTLVPLTQKHH